MGLSTRSLRDALARLVDARSADAAKHPLTYPALGKVLGRPSVARGSWAVVGDVFNERKAASAVVRKLDAEAERCVAISPYGGAGPASGADAGRVDALNLVVSPKIGLAELAATDARYVFLQPGADSPAVLRAARALGKVCQRGCVLVDEFPPVEAGA